MSPAHHASMKYFLCTVLICMLASNPILSAASQTNDIKELTRTFFSDLNRLRSTPELTSPNLDSGGSLNAIPPQSGDCYPAILPTTPEGPTVQRTFSWFNDQFEMTAWRLPCSESNSHVMITIEPLTASAFICSSQLTLVQNGIQNNRDFKLLQDPQFLFAFCGDVFVKTTFAIDHSYLVTPSIDIQQSFDIYWDLGDNIQQFTLFAYDPGDYGGGGEPPSPELSNDAGVNGLFYDPNNPGHGFDIIRHEDGLVVYYYGHTAAGDRLWLISENYGGNLDYNESFRIDMFEVSDGTFGQPVLPASSWGSAELEFSDCDHGQATLNGDDGVLEIDFVRLAAIPNVGCE